MNLRWNSSEYGGVKDLRIPPHRLWKPDVLMYNRLVSLICCRCWLYKWDYGSFEKLAVLANVVGSFQKLQYENKRFAPFARSFFFRSHKTTKGATVKAKISHCSLLSVFYKLKALYGSFAQVLPRFCFIQQSMNFLWRVLKTMLRTG